MLEDVMYDGTINNVVTYYIKHINKLKIYIYILNWI